MRAITKNKSYWQAPDFNLMSHTHKLYVHLLKLVNKVLKLPDATQLLLFLNIFLNVNGFKTSPSLKKTFCSHYASKHKDLKRWIQVVLTITPSCQQRLWTSKISKVDHPITFSTLPNHSFYLITYTKRCIEIEFLI